MRISQDILIIIALIVIGIGGAWVYYNYLYAPVISVTLTSNTTTPATIYPYQKITMHITVFNNGPAVVRNTSLGVLVNGNLTIPYKITLPVGKQVTINYNYSPAQAGNYTITAIFDQAHVYNVQNRQTTQTSVSFFVNKAQNATPALMLPPQNITSFQGSNLTKAGFALASYIYNIYNINKYALTDNSQLNGFLTPLLNLTTLYLKNVTTANAKYPNNASVYSIWISGYISPSIFGIGASASGFTATSINTKATGNVTFIKLSNTTTLCTWYSRGWLKLIGTAGGSNCAAVLNKTANSTKLAGGIGNRLYSKLLPKNIGIIANYSSKSANIVSASTLSIISNASFVYTSISNNTEQNATCYGSIYTLNGTSYCSTFFFPTSGQIQGLSLIRTTEYVNSYNLSAFSLVNTSQVLAQSAIAANILHNLNLTGKSLVFNSALVTQCAFNQSFICNNMAYHNGTIAFSLLNNMSKSVRVNSVKCYIISSVQPLTVNATVAPGKSLNMTTSCYSLASKISGFQLDLNLKLAVNYTVSNSTRTIIGSVFVPFG